MNRSIGDIDYFFVSLFTYRYHKCVFPDVVLKFSSNMRNIFKKQRAYPLATLIFLMLLTTYTAYFYYQSQYQYSISLVGKLAEQQAENLQRIVESDLHFIGAGANFFHSTQPEAWVRFPIFAEQIVSSSDTLIALQWMPRIEKSNLPQHIAKVRKTFPFYNIFTVPKDGVKTLGYILESSTPIFPASDVYPRTPSNFNALGYYSSRERFQLVVDEISRTGMPSVSDKIRLLQDGLDKSIAKTGLLVYHPVFNVEEPKRLIGVVIGVIRSTRYFRSIVSRTASEHELLVRVTDQGFDAEDDPILYQSKGWHDNIGIEISKIVHLPNRNWRIDFRLQKSLSSNNHMTFWGIYLAGIIISVMSSYIVWLMIRDKQHLEVLLSERTEELQFLVDHDVLTGVYNRRVFTRVLSDMIMLNKKFALIVFDIDKFKSINDRYGHIVGDEVLIHVVQVIQKVLLKDDVLVRIGGDEFCIISSISSYPLLKKHLGHVCHQVASSNYKSKNNIIRCTLSIGATIRAEESLEDLIQSSDAQLYHSKKAGRNCVSIAQ